MDSNHRVYSDFTDRPVRPLRQTPVFDYFSGHIWTRTNLGDQPLFHTITVNPDMNKNRT